MGSQTSTEYPTSHMSQLRVPKYDLNSLAVVTVVFNPIKYKSRYELYHKFDEHMSRSGVTLLTIECIFDCPETLGLPLQKFEITREKDPRHLQVTAPSVLWLKENLINIAVKRLPDYIEYVVWLDADIEFQRLDWPHLAIHQLQQYPIVQLFELSSFLGPLGKKQVLRQDYSFAYAIRHQLQLDARRSSECYVHPGYAWGMRRATFDAMGGLLDFSVLGSGDIHFAYALLNRIEETIPAGMTEDYRSLATAWGRRLAQLAGNGTLVGYAPVNIYHYWHGNRVNRGYFERWSILEQYQFSPLKDLEKNNQLGLLRLADPKRFPEPERAKRLEDFEKTIVAHFRSRNEDNIKRAIPAINAKAPLARPKILGTDTVRPTFTLPTYQVDAESSRFNPAGNEESDYVQLRNTHSGYPVTDNASISLNLENDSFFNPPSEGYNARRYYREYDYPRQQIYYDDGNGNERLSAPGEISF